jgi:predicted nucleic acid-binding protein
MMLIYLDTNVFIEAYENQGRLAQAFRTLFRSARRDQSILVTSELTLAELCVEPIRAGRDERINLYRSLIQTRGSFIQAIAIDRDILFEAATCRARASALRLPDAIHIATAIMSNCEMFITNDKRLHRNDIANHIRFLGFEPGSIENLINTAS